MTYNPNRCRIRKNELARRYGCTTRTIDNRVSRGVIPSPHRDEFNRPFWWSDEIARFEAELTGEAAA